MRRHYRRNIDQFLPDAIKQYSKKSIPIEKKIKLLSRRVAEELGLYESLVSAWAKKAAPAIFLQKSEERLKRRDEKRIALEKQRLVREKKMALQKHTKASSEKSWECSVDGCKNMIYPTGKRGRPRQRCEEH